MPQRCDRFISDRELPQPRTTRRMAHGDRQPVEGAFGCKRQTVGTGLRQSDRASLQCTAGAGSGRAAAAPARNVITSVGSPAPAIGPLHEAGALVFADVASIRHAERAVAAGADGLVLLTAGAGGQTGWLNPFVFVRAVRAFFDGPLVLAGGVSDGHALRAAQALGCDLAYMGTKFIATRESMADARYKELLVTSSADDILLTTAFTGLQTNMLRPSIEAAGLDPDNLPLRDAIDIGKDIDIGARESRPKRWKDIWSAGHSVSGVTELLSVDEMVARTLAEYRAAAARARLG